MIDNIGKGRGAKLEKCLNYLYLGVELCSDKA